jgi:hypothetical protein
MAVTETDTIRHVMLPWEQEALGSLNMSTESTSERVRRVWVAIQLTETILLTITPLALQAIIMAEMQPLVPVVWA